MRDLKEMLLPSVESKRNLLGIVLGSANSKHDLERINLASMEWKHHLRHMMLPGAGDQVCSDEYEGRRGPVHLACLGEEDERRIGASSNRHGNGPTRGANRPPLPRGAPRVRLPPTRGRRSRGSWYPARRIR